MNKKTLLALMLALALMLLTACGDGDDKKAAEVTAEPTAVATEAPTATPTAEPTATPTAEPTATPTAEPTATPTAEPTATPTTEPTATPTAEPTATPTAEPTATPTAEPTAEPVAQSDESTAEPTATPTAEPTATPTTEPTAEPTAEPVAQSDEQEENPVLASAYDGAVEIRLEDARADFEINLSTYIEYYAQYGYTMDEYDLDFQQSVAQETVQTLLSRGIVLHHAAQQGYKLTASKEEELAAQAQTTLDSIREYFESYLSYYGLEGEELEQAVEDQLASSGYSYETILDTLKVQDVIDYLNQLATVDASVTDEEVLTYFDAKVTAQKESYADVDTFIDDVLNGEEILYTPEGVRVVQCIFIAKGDEETADEATADEAAATTPDETTADEAAAATPDEAQIAEMTGRAKAMAVASIIRGGKDFTEAMFAYNEDSSSQEQMEAGYPVSADCTLYGDEFKNGAMALEQVGDVSDVVETDYGYFILRYAEDMTPGAVDYESRMVEEISEALENKKNELFSDYLDKMLEDANVVLNDLSPLYHVYVGETVEVTVAYASVTEDTDLTDMPEGDAVARLKAGASLDVLGRIGMDGEEYAFVAVPGTELKGYLNVKLMADMDEAAALAVDNAALSEAAIPVDKLPTFTIVMNDGTLIYGELYPDVAPETVGNFVSLAGEGFYDGLTFHRVIPGFMIQGGDPNGDGTGGPGYAIRGEFSNNGVKNDLSHTRGVLSMARSSAMDSAGSQFFIMHADSDYLDGDYAAFGLVLGGIETVDLIASVPTDSNDKPRNEQAMRTIYVETYGKTYTFTKLED